MAKNARDINGELGEFAITNATSDFSIDLGTPSAANNAALIGTLISVLIKKGVIAGSVTFA